MSLDESEGGTNADLSAGRSLNACKDELILSFDSLISQWSLGEMKRDCLKTDSIGTITWISNNVVNCSDFICRNRAVEVKNSRRNSIRSPSSFPIEPNERASFGAGEYHNPEERH